MANNRTKIGPEAQFGSGTKEIDLKFIRTGKKLNNFFSSRMMEKVGTKMVQH